LNITGDCVSDFITKITSEKSKKKSRNKLLVFIHSVRVTRKRLVTTKRSFSLG
jgi:hypothetical protein